MNISRHAYLILAHANPKQLHILLSLLDDPRNDIYVHMDRKADFEPEELAGCCTHSSVHFVEPRLSVHWGGVNMMRAELALLKAAVATPHAYYHLLSSQDLPLKTQDEIHAFFDAHAGQEFIQCWPSVKARMARFTYYTAFPEGNDKSVVKLANTLVKGALKLFGARINQGIDFHFSSQWFSITHAFAEYVLSRESWLETVFRHTTTPDEVFLATVLWDSPFREKLFDASIHLERTDPKPTVPSGNLRLIDWSRGANCRHPWTFRADDWDLLMDTPCFWARKFDERVDAEIIDRLYEHLRPR